MLDIHRYHSRFVIRTSIRQWMAVVSLLIAALIIGAGLHSHFVPFSFFVLALCAYYPFGWFLLDRWSVSRRYHRNQDKFIEHTATFTNECVSTSSSKADIRLNWDQLASVVSTPHGLMLLTPPHNVWFWLPQRLFDGNNHKDAILKLAADHKVSIRQME